MSGTVVVMLVLVDATHAPLARTTHTPLACRFVKRVDSYSVQGERPYMEDEFSMRMVLLCYNR